MTIRHLKVSLIGISQWQGQAVARQYVDLVLANYSPLVISRP